MPQFIRQRPGTAEVLGTSLGQGLAGVLNELAQHKVGQLQQRQIQTGLEKTGYTPDLAAALAPLAQGRPDIFEPLYKTHAAREEKATQKGSRQEFLKNYFPEETAKMLSNLEPSLLNQVVKQQLQPAGGFLSALFGTPGGQGLEPLKRGTPEQQMQQQAQQQAAIAQDINPINAIKELVGAGAKGAISGITSLGSLPLRGAEYLGVPGAGTAASGLESVGESAKNILTGGQEAQTPELQALSGFVEDVASFLTPGGFLGKVGKIAGPASKAVNAAAKLLHIGPKAAAIVSGAGNGLEYIAKKAGANETGQKVAKVAGMIAAPLASTRLLAKAEVPKLANELSRIVPEVESQSHTLMDSVHGIYKKLQGISNKTDIEESLLNSIGKLEGPKQFNSKNLWELKKDLDTAVINEPGLGKKLSVYLPRFNSELEKGVNRLAKQAPQFSELYKDYVGLNKALETNSIFDNLLSKVRYRPNNPMLSYLIGAGTTALGVKRLPALAATSGALYAGSEALLLGKLLKQSPVFRKYWGDILTAGALGSASDLTKALKNADKVANKEFKNA